MSEASTVPSQRAPLPKESGALRFHWMLPQAGEVAMPTPQAAARYRVEQALEGSPASRPDLPGWTRFAKAAETAGIESVLISFSRHEPDSILTSCALGQSTEKLRFIVAYRSGLMNPATFVQQMNTLSTLVGGRVAINFVAGSSQGEQHAYGDFQKHDDRYARTAEFLDVCQAFWRRGSEKVDHSGPFFRVEQGHFPTPFLSKNRTSPEIYASGHSAAASQLVHSHASCWLRGGETPEKLAPIVAQSHALGVEVGLRFCVLTRPSREEAVEIADSLIPECQIGMWGKGRDQRDDSVMYEQSAKLKESWLSPTIWTGLVPLCGPVWATLLGTPREVADLLLEYRRIGVSQFILSGWPEIEEVARFGNDVLPLVREGERKLAAA